MARRREEAWRDSHGMALQDYPHPSVAVDTAVLTVAAGYGGPPALCVVLTHRDDPEAAAPTWGLPGTFLHQGERLADAVLRALREKAGIEGLAPEQLRVFDDPTRDVRGWVLSVGHMDVVPERALARAITDQVRVRIVPVTDVVRGHESLPFDHQEIVRAAVARIQLEYGQGADPRRLLRGPFTLRQLEMVHRAVDPDTEPKDTFRRRVIADLEPTGSYSSGTVGKPARYFRRR